MRAQRAEEYLDENAAKRAESVAVNESMKRATMAASLTRKKSARPKTAPSARGPPLPPKNPAEIGIPEGGNWKSTTTYKYDEHSASQLPAPWATHYQVFERFPETVRSERSKKTRMLETKMIEIQAQLKAVEEELQARNNERTKVEASYDRTRKANGLPPRSIKKYGMSGKKKRGVGARKQAQQRKSNTVTISDSARDYLKNM